jgi:diacylglycerol kinase family enzyme
MHFVGVLNKDGGTFRTMDMAAFAAAAHDVFVARGHTLECRVVGSDELVEALEVAASDAAADAVMAGGGDGTISAAAGVCFAAGKPLAVLPAGTMNLFARSLQMPLALDQALEAVASGVVQQVDIATANGRPFVHQYTVGMHSRLVRIRNGMTYHGRLGKMAASVRAVFEALSRPLEFDLELATRKNIEKRRATAIGVSNNLLMEGHVPFAEEIDKGVLGVYVVEPMPGVELARFAVTLMFGKWKQHPMVSEKEVRDLTLTFRRTKKSFRAVLDGELIPLERQVRLKIHAGALNVVAPPLAPADNADSNEKGLAAS